MTETTKKCWSCPTTTPYDQGWCNDCWNEIPQDIRNAVNQAKSEPFAGMIRMATCDALSIERSKQNRYKPTNKKLNLNDLEI